MQAPHVQKPPCLCTTVCGARQATTMATAGGPARQAGTKQAETAAPVHKRVQGSAGNNNGNSRRASRASRHQKCRHHRDCAQKCAMQSRQQQWQKEKFRCENAVTPGDVESAAAAEIQIHKERQGYQRFMKVWHKQLLPIRSRRDALSTHLQARHA